jgi:CheY-like chemotaxis protein
MRILAIEDSPSARKLLQEILLRLGVTLPDLRLAADSQEALQVFTQWRPELVFLDIDLQGSPVPLAAPAGPRGGASEPTPRMNGDELGLHLLDRNPGLKLVILTALDREDPRVRPLVKRGAVEVIVKPILASKIQTVLDKLAVVGKAPRRR